jgi:ribosomal protein L16 Arg81 hydroxylase
MESHLSGNRPVLVKDGLQDWPAMERWSPASIGHLAPNGLVDLLVSLKGSFRTQPDRSPIDANNQLRFANVKLSHAAEQIVDSEPSQTKYYISQQSIILKLPELLPDLRCWWPIEGSVVNLWFGSSGIITPLHFDKRSNLFAQVYGTKRLTLFAPDQSQYLYPYPADSALPHISHVDVEDPNWRRHPDFALAERSVLTIKPGEMLFLPALWWHHVESLSISISVNQWTLG